MLYMTLNRIETIFEKSKATKPQEASIVQLSAFGLGFGNFNRKGAVYEGSVLNDYVKNIRKNNESKHVLQKIERADIFGEKESYRFKDEIITFTDEEVAIPWEHSVEKLMLGFMFGVASNYNFALNFRGAQAKTRKL